MGGDLGNEQKEGAKQDPVKTLRARKLGDEWLSEGHQNAVHLCLSLLGLVESQRESSCVTIPHSSWDEDCRGQGLVSLAAATEAVGESSIAWLLTSYACISLVIHGFYHFSTCKL